ncbi:helix-turn-helix transcriptional regulator [Sulfitobacter sp. D7]|uniref:helix-turn-helix transcriptional regulator n=1 Tax=Sulfitobacter sp. D7 TaxID=1968541 RepID=UPI000E77AF33|nr:AlpA family phage regulatory protein [Sulfitobacter sp. D7]AYE84842.1 hypothetical protein B5M07_01195 [Sulfitobacter sp. D7]
MTPLYYNFHDIMILTGLGRSTIYRRIEDGTLPGPVKIGHRSLWRRDEFITALALLERP